MNNFFKDEYLVKAWDGCSTSKLLSKEFLTLSRHGHFFISINADTRTYINTPLDMSVLEETIASIIDDILEESEFLGNSTQDMSWDLASSEVFKGLQRRFELSGLEISLVDNILEFDHEEDRETREVTYSYMRLKP